MTTITTEAAERAKMVPTKEIAALSETNPCVKQHVVSWLVSDNSQPITYSLINSFVKKCKKFNDAEEQRAALGIK